VLGNTFGMLVLQDFEALTPNLLARTVETVEGGGIVVVLLSTLDSLTKLYSLTMDSHSKFRTEAHPSVTGRFNERLVLSLGGCATCVVTDDELNILPISSHIRHIAPLEDDDAGGNVGGKDGLGGAAALKDLIDSLADAQPAGALVAGCRTMDQARAVATFVDAASERTLRSTVALTAARGRGKSAALGLSIAGALALGYSNIFVTAPSPENLRTLFEFAVRGLEALGHKEHLDYDLVESASSGDATASTSNNKNEKSSGVRSIVRLNVFRTHRQTVQYIHPQHHAALAQAELLVIDEAAAIPLPLVRAMLGPYLVFLCSTINGYEGTGRSLSVKLIKELRSAAVGGGGAGGAGSGRTFREVVLQEPIRCVFGVAGPGCVFVSFILLLHYFILLRFPSLIFASTHLPATPLPKKIKNRTLNPFLSFFLAHTQVRPRRPPGVLAECPAVLGRSRPCPSSPFSPASPLRVLPVLPGTQHFVFGTPRLRGAAAPHGCAACSFALSQRAR
jgi:N-acetyltransferase 10